MTCCICYSDIDDGAPMLVVNASLNGRPAKRFTGIAWHPECSPIEFEHLRAETRALAAHDAEVGAMTDPRGRSD